MRCTVHFFGVYLYPPKNCYSDSLNITFYIANSTYTRCTITFTLSNVPTYCRVITLPQTIIMLKAFIECPRATSGHEINIMGVARYIEGPDLTYVPLATMSAMTWDSEKHCNFVPLVTLRYLSTGNHLLHFIKWSRSSPYFARIWFAETAFTRVHLIRGSFRN